MPPNSPVAAGPAFFGPFKGVAGVPGQNPDSGGSPSSALYTYDFQITDPGELNTDRASRWDGNYRGTNTGAAHPTDPVFVGGTDGAATLSFWLYNRSTSNSSAVFGAYISGLNTVLQSFSAVATSFDTLSAAFYLDSGTASLSGGTCTADAWSHIVMIFDPTQGTDGEAYSYINGSLVTTAVLGSGRVRQTVNSGTRFGLGGARIHAASGAIWNGNILCMSHWSKAISSSDVTTLYNSGTPLWYTSYSGGLSDCNMFYGLTESAGEIIADRTETHPDLDTYLPESTDDVGFALPGGLAVDVSSWEDGNGAEDLSGTASIDRDVDPIELEFSQADQDTMSTTLSSALVAPYTFEIEVNTGDVLEEDGTFLELTRAGGADPLKLYITDSVMFIDHEASGVSLGVLVPQDTDSTMFHVTVAADGTLEVFANGGSLLEDTTSTQNVTAFYVGNDSAGTDGAGGKVKQLNVYDSVLSQDSIDANVLGASLTPLAPITILGTVIIGGTFATGTYMTGTGYSMKKPSGSTICATVSIPDGLLVSGTLYNISGTFNKAGSVVSNTIRLRANSSNINTLHFATVSTPNGDNAIDNDFTPTFAGGATLDFQLTQDASTPPRNTYSNLVIAEA